MNKMNTLERLALSLLVSLLCLSVSAQKLALTFNNVSLSDALKQIDQAQELKHVHFVFDELEDFRVSKTISSESAYDAVREVCGFYPMLISMRGKDIFVECAQKDDAKLIGRVVDENGKALEFANVALYSVPDSTFITGGVTNKNGDFVIPCGKKNVHVNFSYIGFETKEMKVEFPGGAKSLNVGTITLNEDKKIIREVLVEQTLASTSAEKSEYLPSKKQKNAAADATSLLQHMQIPQLRLNPLTGYVTTLSGESVGIFIDFMPATAEDLAGMNTQDVKRVDVYDFPKDVRFQNQKHVINFIMQKYEYGGYTKLSTTDMLMSGKDYQAGGSVYSKLVSKAWTFDANLSDTYSDLSHNGAKSEAVFRLPSQTITRNELSENGKSRLHKPSASLRATYNTEKIQLANRFEILCEDRPKRDMSGNVTYEPSLFNSASSESRNTSKSLTPKYQGNWFFALPKQWSLTANPEFFYMKNDVNRFYSEGDRQPIENKIKENASYLTWQVGLSKTFAQRHTVSLMNFGINYHSAMDYTGSVNSASSMNMLVLGQGIAYNFAMQKFDLSADLTFAYSNNKMDGAKYEECYPVGNISATFAPSQKHSLTLQLSRGQQGAEAAKRNGNIMQENELLYYSGNPLMEDYDMELIALQYSWMPSNTFTASAYAQTILSNNYFANTYQIYNDGTALIRKMENVGDLNQTDLGASLTLRLLNGKLQLNASPSLQFYNIRGEYDKQKTLFNLTSWASYYIGNYYLQAYAKTAERAYDKVDNAWRTTLPYFYLRAGWGNARWKANVTISNPFRTNWRTTRTEISTPLYTLDSQAFGATSHQRLNLTVSYTFNYGKKVKQGNELGTATGGQSSIL